MFQWAEKYPHSSCKIRWWQMDQLIIIRTTSLLSTLCLPYFSHLCVTSCFTKILFIRKAHLFFDLPSYFLKGFLMFYLQQILHIFKQITLLISPAQGYVFRLVVHNSYLYNSFRMKMSFLFCFFSRFATRDPIFCQEPLPARSLFGHGSTAY